MKKTDKTKTGTGRSVIFIAITCILAGFIGGAGFSSFKLGKESFGRKIQPEKKSMEKELKTQAAQNPENPEAWIQLGNFYFDTNRYSDAIEAYSTALEMDPGNADVITDMGVMYRRSNRPEKAVQAFDRAIASDPAHETARLNKGVVLLNDLNDAQGAVAAWEGLLEINPFFMVGNGKSLKEVVEAYR